MLASACRVAGCRWLGLQCKNNDNEAAMLHQGDNDMDWMLLVFLASMAVVAAAVGYAVSELIHLNRKSGGEPRPETVFTDETWRAFRLRGRR